MPKTKQNAPLPVAEILNVGTELLLGDILNTNAQYLSAQLALCGVGVYAQSTVGDNPARLKQAVESALSKCDILICTGGLGPTKDDLTKETVAECFGLPLELDHKALEQIESYFVQVGRPMTENNKKQAYLPKGAEPLYNQRGTAPGIWLEQGGKTVILLPGPPGEMKTMFETSVLPRLTKRSGYVLVSRVLKVFGLGESLIETKISDLLENANPTVALYAKEGQVEIRITACAESARSAALMNANLSRKLVERLGDKVYSTEGKDLPEVVSGLLQKTGKRLVTVESCTGGLIAKLMTDHPGASKVFQEGYITYSDEVKEKLIGVSKKTLEKYTAVSAETAKEMALGALEKSGADYAVSVTGVAGPGGGSKETPVGLVYLAVSNGQATFVQKIQMGKTKTRGQVRSLAALYGLDMIRRLILCPDSLAKETLYANHLAKKEEPLMEHQMDETKKQRAHSPVAAFQKKKWYQWLLENLIPQKKDSVAEIVRKCVLLVAIPVFIISATSLIGMGLDSVSNQMILDEVRDIYEEKAPVPQAEKEQISYPADYQDSFFELYKINPDVMGYLKIEGTQIDFPIVQAEDNDYYLRRSFKGQKSDHGVAFFDCRNDLKKPSDNLVIYGHNMRDSSMFGTLTAYKDLSYYKAHPVIQLDSVYEDGTYLIFAAFYANADVKSGPVFAYHNYVDFENDKEFVDYYQKVMRRSLWNTGVEVEPGDEILTLSTCTYEISDGRFVLLARRLREGESATPNVGKAVVNPSPLYPKAWYTTFGMELPEEYLSSGTASRQTTTTFTNQTSPTSNEEQQPSRTDREESSEEETTSASQTTTTVVTTAGKTSTNPSITTVKPTTLPTTPVTTTQEEEPPTTTVPTTTHAPEPSSEDQEG